MEEIGEGNPFCDLLMNDLTMVNYLAALAYRVNRDLEAANSEEHNKSVGEGSVMSIPEERI